MSTTKKLLRDFLKVAFGAGTVVGGTYIFSRIREKQETETRLDRLEQIIQETQEKEKK